MTEPLSLASWSLPFCPKTMEFSSNLTSTSTFPQIPFPQTIFDNDDGDSSNTIDFEHFTSPSFIATATLATFLILLIGPKPFFSLTKIPGPFLARFTSLYRVYLLWSGNCTTHYSALHAKYGSVVRIGPQHVLVSDPAALPKIYGARRSFRKSDFYRIFTLSYRGETRDTLLTVRDPDEYDAMHTHIAGRFNAENLGCYETCIEACTRAFIERMKTDKALVGQPVNFSKWIKFWAFDTNSSFEFGGTGFEFINKGYDIKDIVSGVDIGFRLGSLVAQLPWLNAWVFENRHVLRVLGWFAKIPDPALEITQMIEERIAEFDAHPEQHDTPYLLAWFRSEQANPKKIGLDDSMMLIHLANYFVAGGVSTATTVGAIIYHTIKHPEVYKRLVAELRQDVSTESGNVNRQFAHAEVRNMPYLQAVIKEAMRLTPATSMSLERIVPPGGVEIDDHYIEPGTNIGVSAYVVNRDRSIFGADADKFRPERWLEADASTLRKMQQCFFSFGRGERGCGGRALVMMVLSKFVAQILRELDIEWANSQRDTWDLKAWWMPVQSQYYVRFTPVA